jgi:hypothetical protein
MLSQWPETYSYTLSETWAAGIPVIVSPYGALAERVRDTKAGIVLRDLNVRELVDTVRHLDNSASSYETLIQNVSRITHRTVSEMANDYWRLYESLWQNVPAEMTAQETNFQLQQQISRSSFAYLDLRVTEPTEARTSAEHLSLSVQVWQVLNALFPDTFIGRLMTFTVAIYLYATKYGFRTMAKRIAYLRKEKQLTIPRRN